MSLHTKSRRPDPVGDLLSLSGGASGKRYPPENPRLLLGEAERALGELKGIGRRLPNYLFTRPFVNREAVLSSRIEGTQASLSDLYALEANVPTLFPELEVRQDAEEVQNYVRALEHGLNADLPISARLLREMHAVLMQGVRGQSRAPGEFRRSQNWIGPAGARRRDATFVPAPPGPILEQALGTQRS